MPSILVSHLAYQILRYLREFYLSNAIKLKTVKAITV